MERCKLNKTAKALGFFMGALLVTIVALGAVPQPAKAVTWLPTQIIVEMAQDLRETQVTPPVTSPPFDCIEPSYLTPCPQYAYYVLSAENFVLHIDEFNDIDDADIIDLSNASVSFEGESSFDTTPTVVVKENTLSPTVGAHELILGLEETEGDGACLGFGENCLEENLNTDGDFLNADAGSCPILDAATLPVVHIYVFVVDDNTTIEEGVVFYANNFQKDFTERAGLTARSVIERAQASAHEVLTGLYLSENIFLNEEELAEFVQSDRLDPQTLTLSVPATATPMTAEDAIAANIPLVSTSIMIITNDNRPPSGNNQGENNNNSGNNSNIDNSGNNNNTAGTTNNNRGNISGNNNANNNDNSNNNNNLTTGTTSSSNTGANNSSGNQNSGTRSPWTSSVRRSPVQVSPSEPSEEVGTESEDVSDDLEEDYEPQEIIAAGTGEADRTNTPAAAEDQPRQPAPTAAPTAETTGEESTFFRNVMITVFLAIAIAAVIALYLHFQGESLQKRNSTATPLRTIRPEQHLEPLP